MDNITELLPNPPALKNIEHTNLKSTKFILGMTGIIAATGLCAFRILDATVYSTIVIFAMGIYSTANVTQKVAS